MLKEGALTSIINIVEVLESPSQKLVFTIISGLMRAVNNCDSFSQWVVPALPQLSSFLKFQGQEFAAVSEMALECFLSLMLSMERMDSSQARTCVESLNNFEILSAIIRLAEALPRLSNGILRLLRSLCRFSINSLRGFLALDAAKFISGFLDGEEQLLQDALSLTASLLPGAHDREAVEFYQSHPEYLKQIGAAVLPKVLRAYDSAGSRGLKRVCLEIVDKLLARCPPQMIKGLMSPRDVAWFLRELLDSREVPVVKTALKLTYELFEKLPDDMSLWLTREGVLSKVTSFTSEVGISDLFEAETRAILKRNSRNYVPSRADAHSMEQLIAQIRQRSQRVGRNAIRPEDMAGLGGGRGRAGDPVQESKTDFQKLAVKVSERCGGERTGAIGVMSALRTIKDRFNSGGDPVDELLSVLTSAEDVTSYELCGSDVLTALWTWLTSDPPQTCPRLYRLLTALTVEGKDGELLLSLFVRKLTSVLRFAHNFPIVVQELGQIGGHFSLRALTQRACVTLVFQPELNPALDASEMAEKREVFARTQSLNVSMELYQTLDLLREALSKVKTTDDLARFSLLFQRSFSEIRGLNRDRPSYRHARSFNEDFLQMQEEMDPRDVLERLRRMEAEEGEEDDSEMAEEDDPELVRPADRKDSVLTATLVAKLFFNRQEVQPGTTLYELTSRCGADLTDGVIIHFSYFHKEIAYTDASTYLCSGRELIANLLSETSNVGVAPDTGAYLPLRLLKLLNACNRHMVSLLSSASLLFPGCRAVLIHSTVPPQTFYSQQMTSLLSKQLQDITAMTGGIAADWVKDVPRLSSFLFPFPVRVQLLRSWALGPLKSLAYFSQKLKNTQDSFTVRVPRHKVCVQREKVLESAQRVMRDRNLIQTGLLEFDFQGEEGTGKGPTLEFYSLASRSIRLLSIWRNSGEESGLFPSPTGPSNSEEQFEFIGRLVGKSLIDERLLDLPLSPSFWKLIFRLPLVLTDVLKVDKQLGETLLEMQSVLNRKQCGEADLTYRGTHITDLHLTFTLPGYEDFELKEHGKCTLVTLESLEEYIQLVATATLMQTTASEAFRKGLEVLVPVERLRMFSVEELECLLCGEQDEDWHLETLAASIVAAHGYTKACPAFQQVLLVMAQFTPDERKLFLQFVTGSPRLPLGGFAGLSPPLTVVRRDTEGSGCVDDYLPSVMTCQNYLKVPLYSCFEVLRRQLLYACSEGHESFHLS